VTAPVTVGDLVRSASALFEVSIDAIVNGGRHSSVARARFAVAWTAHRRRVGSVSQIGRLLGGRQHSTILWAIGRAEAIRDTDVEFRERTDHLLTTVGTPRSDIATAILSIQ
jgi:chromosomal replication initiator protein